MRLLKLGSAFICVVILKLGATENSAAEAACPDDSLPCDNGDECFKRTDWCNKIKDCKDGSDESYCKKKSFWNSNPNGCTDNQFLCDDGQCLPKIARCDGHKDCSDESDENKCTSLAGEVDSEDDDDDYIPDLFETTTKHTISENFSDDYEDEDIPSTSPAPKLTTTFTPMETTYEPIISSTLSVDLLDRESEEVNIHASIPVTTPDAPLRSSITPVDFYAKRQEEESGQSVFQTSPSSTVPSYLPPATTENVHVPGAYQKQDIRTTTTTFQPLSQTASSHYSNKHYERPQVPITQPRQSRGRLNPSSITTSQPTRPYDSRLTDQWGASFTHPTKPHVALTAPHDPRRESYQHSTQPTRNSDSRRDSYQYRTYPPRPYDARRDPYSNSPQPKRTYDSRPESYQYNTQPNRPYDSRQDSYHHQTQPTRSHYSRQDAYQHQASHSVPTRHPYYPYQSPGELAIRATTPGTRYPAVTHHVYLDHGIYYGYYDDDGRFVVLRTNGDDRPSYLGPRNVGPRNDQSNRNPPRVEERNRQEPLYVTPTPIAFTRQLKVPPRFYFQKNYARIYENKHHSYLRKAKEHILSLRNATGGWGVETPRALVALSLTNNSFVNDTYENDMMQKYLQVFLGTSLLRGDSKSTTLTRLAMAINGLLATCHNPRDFQGADLSQLVRKQLHQMTRDRTRRAPVNPSVYLSLCLADRELTHSEVHDLMTRLNAHSTPDEYSKDMLSLSIIAFSCHLQQQQHRDSDYFRSLQSLLSNATSKLIDRMLDDGSFGSVYSTALAAQALISVNDSRQWDAESTFDFLKQQQLRDGSFGDFLATYWTLPVLSGRSLLHLRNMQCTPPKADRDLTPSEIMEFTGPKQHIRYSLYIGYPNVNGNSVEVLVPQGISFFDIMRVAELQNDAFKFSYEEKDEQIHVYSISNVPNDPERGFQWNLYAKRNTDAHQNKLNFQERVTGDVRDFYPRPDQHVIFWYHPSDIHS